MERETIKDKKTGVERKRMKEKKVKRQARATDRCRICVPKRIPGIIPIQGMIIPGKLSSAAQERGNRRGLCRAGGDTNTHS